MKQQQQVSVTDQELVAFRRRLHAHPEISFAEYDTTAAIAQRLTVQGLHPERLASGTGLICDIGSGEPTVAIRADIDALSLDDPKDVPYRSQNPGATHACGHDVHTAAALGAALMLAEQDLPGRVRMIFEPGEERVPGGAKEIVDEGLMVGVDAVIGLHCDPKLSVGQVGWREGPITSAADWVQVQLKGPGGHTARPHLTVNLVEELAKLAVALPADLESLVGQPDQVRLVFGAIHAGQAANVIPAEGTVAGSLRTPYLALWENLPTMFAEIVAAALADSSAGWDIEHVQGVPPVVNNPALAAQAKQSAQALLGPDAVVPTEQSWGGDSFGWLSRAAPGMFLRLGTSPVGSPGADLHNPHFDVDERAIGIGARLLASIAKDLLADL